MQARPERFHWLLLPVLAVFCSALPGYEQPDSQPKPGLAALVNPLAGTANSGNTFPGAVLPFGMVAHRGAVLELMSHLLTLGQFQDGYTQAPAFPPISQKREMDGARMRWV